MQEPNNESRAKKLAICHRGYVMETGKIILSGAAAELSGNDRVRQAYLGG
jgi:branched-chain amino acid transport system ATP-binding protein